MDIKPYDKTIRELFVSGRQFSIPRFQREYSWDKKNYQEFYQDMMSNLIIENGQDLQLLLYFFLPCLIVFVCLERKL